MLNKKGIFFTREALKCSKIVINGPRFQYVVLLILFLMQSSHYLSRSQTDFKNEIYKRKNIENGISS